MSLPLRGRRASLLSQFLQDILIRETMKAVVPKTFLEEGFGQGISLGQLRHASVKCSVKAGHLGQVRIKLMNRYYPFNFIGKMVGSQRYELF